MADRAPALRGDAVRVVLALGSNLGDRLGNLSRGVEMLSKAMTLETVSSVYASAPVGYLDQPEFFNAVLIGVTSLSPASLLDLARSVESAVGRRRSFPNAPRTLDVDVVFYGDRVLDLEDLVVPHPRWHERSFVLAPLAEIAPALEVPPERRTVVEVWSERRADLPPVDRVAGPRAIWKERS